MDAEPENQKEPLTNKHQEGTSIYHQCMFPALHISNTDLNHQDFSENTISRKPFEAYSLDFKSRKHIMEEIYFK